MPNGVSADQWFLEVNGKKFGPYTMAQINALVRHHEIVGEDKVTASHLNGKWITVQEFVNKGDPAASTPDSSSPAGPSGQRSAQTIPQGAPGVVPPRPDERTLTSITTPVSHSNEPRKSGSDAVLNLFEILQAARERKTQTPSAAAAQAIIDMPRPVRSSSGAAIFWIAVPAMITVAVAAWRMTSSHPAATVAETEAPAKTAPAQKSAPVTASASTAQKPPQTRTVAAAVPAAKPKPVTHAPGFSVGRQVLKQTPSTSSVSEREREREIEREAERELEREKERDAEYARGGAPADSRGYDRDRERERERESERDHRDRGSDRGGSDRIASDRGNDRYDRYDRATSSAGGPDAIPVTGGIPAEPGSFREPASGGLEGDRSSGYSPPASQ